MFNVAGELSTKSLTAVSTYVSVAKPVIEGIDGLFNIKLSPDVEIQSLCTLTSAPAAIPSSLVLSPFAKAPSEGGCCALAAKVPCAAVA